MPKSRLRTTAFIIVMALPTIGWAADTAPSYDSYKSWFVACDNGLTCQARGFKDDGSAESPDLTFTRDAGPDAEPFVTLQIPFSAEPSELKVDGGPVNVKPDTWTVEKEDSFTTLSLRGEAVADLVSQLRDANELQTSNPEAVIPLDGFVAALLRMDDRQGRIGGVTALIRKGKAPASTVPQAPDLPTAPVYKPAAPLKAGEDAKLIARAQADLASTLTSEECNTEMTSDISRSEAFALDDTKAVAILACSMAAYQGSSIVAIVPRAAGKPAQLVRPDMPIAEESDTASFTDPTFDTKTGMLMMGARGRGLGDCGVSADWTWYGEQFRLTNASYQMACGGSGPGDWPTIYRSR